MLFHFEFFIIFVSDLLHSVLYMNWDIFLYKNALIEAGLYTIELIETLYNLNIP